MAPQRNPYQAYAIILRLAYIIAMLIAIPQQCIQQSRYNVSHGIFSTKVIIL